MDLSESQKQIEALLLDPNIKPLLASSLPKNLVLIRLGMLQPDGSVNQARVKALSELNLDTIARGNDPQFWLMKYLEMTALLLDKAIDLDGNILVEELDIEPFLHPQLRTGLARTQWDQFAGIWLYPNISKPLPKVLTQKEIEYLQKVCWWLSPEIPRRPRPFFWALQDMVMTAVRNGKPLDEKQSRKLARYIHQNKNEAPDFEVLARL